MPTLPGLHTEEYGENRACVSESRVKDFLTEKKDSRP